jgi:hypothetical protein
VSDSNLKQTFETLTDFLDHVTGPTTLSPEFLGSPHAKRERADRYNDRTSWYDVRREKKAGEHPGACVLRLALKGWPLGAKLLESVAHEVNPPPARNIRRRHRWHDSGDEIHMQRVYAGDLDRAWSTTTKQVSTGPSRIRIIVDAIASGGLEASLMRWRGVAAMKLADTLTQAGYVVQVESAFVGHGGSDGILGEGDRNLRVIVKSYQAPLDLEALAATTALPGFFRALGHAWAGGNMSVYHLTAEHIIDEADSALGVIIPQSIQDASSAAQIVNQILESLEKAQEQALSEMLA